MKLVVIDGHDHWEVDGRLMPAISGGFGADVAVVMAVVAIAASVAAAGVSAYSQYQAGQAQNKAAKYNARVMENQMIAARQAAEMKANEIRTKNRFILATARNNAYASGGTVAPGTSALEILAYDAEQGELSALRTEYTGEVEALGYEAQKRMYRFQGEQAAYSGMLGAGSTILSGIGSAANMGYNMYTKAPSTGTGITSQRPTFYGGAAGLRGVYGAGGY